MPREICGECKYNKYSTTEKEFYCSNTDSDNYGIRLCMMIVAKILKKRTIKGGKEK